MGINYQKIKCERQIIENEDKSQSAPTSSVPESHFAPTSNMKIDYLPYVREYRLKRQKKKQLRLFEFE